jgi:hypothetical protein
MKLEKEKRKLFPKAIFIHDCLFSVFILIKILFGLSRMDFHNYFTAIDWLVVFGYLFATTLVRALPQRKTIHHKRFLSSVADHSRGLQ